MHIGRWVYGSRSTECGSSTGLSSSCRVAGDICAVDVWHIYGCHFCRPPANGKKYIHICVVCRLLIGAAVWWGAGAVVLAVTGAAVVPAYVDLAGATAEEPTYNSSCSRVHGKQQQQLLGHCRY